MLAQEVRELIVNNDEAMEMLGVSRMTLNNYVRSGKLSFIERGIYLKSEIEYMREMNNSKFK